MKSKKKTSQPKNQVWITKDEIASLVELRHNHPHRLLGMHPLGEGRGLVIRVFRPDARAVTLLEGKQEKLRLTRIHSSGLFEGHLPDENEVFPYRLRVEGHNSKVIDLGDPYSHLPSVTDHDLHLLGEGRLMQLYDVLGAQVRTHEGVQGVSFAVWAPTATRVSVIGDWNYWDGRYHMMRALGSSGVWEIFIPGLGPGDHYRFQIRKGTGHTDLRSDPIAFASELRPRVASRITDLKRYKWGDKKWMTARKKKEPMNGPMSIYELHLGSWIRKKDGAWLNYRELATKLIPYVKELGFTHIELLPVAEHPFDGSWGYQVTGYFAPTSRFGTPEDFMYFVDQCHQENIAVLVDWVPAHFPRDEFALARFDGTEVYEHADPRQGEHPDWGTLVFNYGRNEVRNFLIANALFWLDRYHIDGFRVDAVASMLYLDYSREPGDWVPNQYGGRENLEALAFIKELNHAVREDFPGTVMIAEESTSWPQLTHELEDNGLGFHGKWNMGFMHDMLAYFKEDPVFRVHSHEKLTFGLLYAFSEKFVLPFSHDEVVHGKASLLAKMPGDEWQKFANLRALYGYMFGHPGKKLLFMGAELGTWREWNFESSLEFHLLQFPYHRGIHELVKDLCHLYKNEPSLWELDHNWEGFQWIDFSDAAGNVVSWVRRGKKKKDFLVCVYNLSPVPKRNYRVGVPKSPRYEIVLNTDDSRYGGSALEIPDSFTPLPEETHEQPETIQLTLPPLSALFLKPAKSK
ncbi:MAG: 1,4-alpha-glucan branching protein GlgB [Candidatus Eisenbacteria bacterium]|uniref:1,4-alpha-glucan branching enzyme GlgB n=1 Tax=Eiseniibacteriota bacterium TaxID=2212470 RepID=A0A7Y2H186_UNCEI|nr:1,4-alpha-glucan branching protein GlgB [Candidatus Eisenbacteria bacterium]